MSIPLQVFNLTDKQSQLLEITKSKLHTLAAGGSRSGKTAGLIYFIFLRALKYPGSRHLIARYRFNHAKISLWLDTIAKIQQFFPRTFERKESDHYIKFFNGSEIWIDGLDDKERVEKILGREYNTIYFNEVYQIPYDSVELVLSRLSLKTEGCRNKAYYDCNPTNKMHWAYKLFVQKLHPIDGLALINPDDYGYIQINPYDNQENIDSGYIENILSKLSPQKRKRFLDGEWGDLEGAIFENWDIVEEFPEEAARRGKKLYGLDFGYKVDPTAYIEGILYGKDLYLRELIYQSGLDNNVLYSMIEDSGSDMESRHTGDSAEVKTIDEFRKRGLNIKPAKKGRDSIMFGINYLWGLNIHILRDSINIQNEFSYYTFEKSSDWKPIKGKPIDDFNHAIDAIRYMCEDEAMGDNYIKSGFNASSIGL